MALVALAGGDILDAVDHTLAGAAAQEPKEGVPPRPVWSASGSI